MTSFTTETIEKFTAMVKRSVNAHAKDMRIDMNDATSLMAEIANVLARLAVLENKTVQRQETTTAQMDGGSFGR
jgi:hypothetical protein